TVWPDFFFQAEDGIRDLIVTGVQTCALPISAAAPDAVLLPKPGAGADIVRVGEALAKAGAPERTRLWAMIETPLAVLNVAEIARSEERRVGKECRWRWWGEQ